MFCESLEIEFDCELNQARIVTRRNNPAEVAGIADNLPLFGSTVRHGVQVADRIREIYVIEKVEKLSAQFDAH